MNKDKKTTSYLPLILGGMGLIILSAVTYILQTNQDSSSAASDPFILPPAEMDQPSPDFSLSDLDGNQVALKDFLGEVVLLNNWATWCPPCRQEMPEFQAYFEEHRNEGFQIIAVEAGQPLEEVQKFVDDHDLTFTILLDPENISLTAFQSNSLPNTWIIDRNGRLRLAWLGAINGDTLEKYVTPLIKE
jgi:cytochrome c biogenesis protein CcmG/thiol:disulfide interchange protein DsbE